jgi:hypothetical protein
MIIVTTTMTMTMIMIITKIIERATAGSGETVDSLTYSLKVVAICDTHAMRNNENSRNCLDGDSPEETGIVSHSNEKRRPCTQCKPNIWLSILLTE